MKEYKKVILYIAMSLDGYIATKNDSIDFLSIVEQEGEDYGYNDFMKTIDTIILGRKTYQKISDMGASYPLDKSVYVITRTEKEAFKNVVFYTENIKTLIENLKRENIESKNQKNIFCDGGAEIVNELLKENLIDEFYISIIPIFLGDGISLFKNNRPPLNLKLIESKSFEKGLVQLHYIKESNYEN